jgi:hypothetical protein
VVVQCRIRYLSKKQSGGIMPSESEYIPGVCNIGLSEIQMRKYTGWFGLGITIILWIVFYIQNLPSVWRLLLFFPALMSAIGFLQAKMRFCAAFGILGFFNFNSKVGQTNAVKQAAYRRKDKLKALLIIIYSILIGISVAAVGYFV